jgi:hypothetical protein
VRSGWLRRLLRKARGCGLQSDNHLRILLLIQLHLLARRTSRGWKAALLRQQQAAARVSRAFAGPSCAVLLGAQTSSDVSAVFPFDRSNTRGKSAILVEVKATLSWTGEHGIGATRLAVAFFLPLPDPRGPQRPMQVLSLRNTRGRRQHDPQPDSAVLSTISPCQFPEPAISHQFL